MRQIINLIAPRLIALLTRITQHQTLATRIIRPIHKNTAMLNIAVRMVHIIKPIARQESRRIGIRARFRIAGKNHLPPLFRKPGAIKTGIQIIPTAAGDNFTTIHHLPQR